MQPEVILEHANKTALLSILLQMLPFVLKEKGFEHALFSMKQV